MRIRLNEAGRPELKREQATSTKHLLESLSIPMEREPGRPYGREWAVYLQSPVPKYRQRR